ncbi:MAG: hypothetical protein PF503_03825 [Desulfobacula sp.]|jgi:hypothetical protein|nr:hypothetical protein [Desulfobacula sp.]
MMVEFLLYLMGFWSVPLILILFSRYKLLITAWNEPYFVSALVVIESDDWGPGDEGHILGLKELLAVLGRHMDSKGRSAVLTANIILTVPDGDKIIQHDYQHYYFKSLPEHFQKMLIFMVQMYNQGLFFPQLHGLAHYHPEKITELAGLGNDNVRNWISHSSFEWEQLPHPLQSHYIDGTTLPSRPVEYEIQENFVKISVLLFKQAFGFDSTSTVAPCYLWDDNTEKIWSDSGFRYIQTAGYRCTGLDLHGAYLQCPKILRTGDQSPLGLIYLVRTVMFEPKDFSDAEKICIKGIEQAVNQGLPVVISTHRYNYAGTGSCLISSVEALDRILNFITKNYNDIHFLNSEELGKIIEKKTCLNTIQFFFKVRAFLYRVWYRHRKIRFLSYGTLLILPGVALIGILNLFKKSGDR